MDVIMHEERHSPAGSRKGLLARWITILVVLAVLGAACSRSTGQPSAASTSNTPVAIGDVAPAFSLPSATGDHVSLADFAGKKPVLLFFSMGPG